MEIGTLELGLGWGSPGGGEAPEPAAPTIVSNVISPSSGEVGQAFDGVPSITGYPTPTPTYQWQDSADGSTGWANIGGATSRSYTSIGETFLRRLVSATNSEGSDGPDSSNVVEVTAIPVPADVRVTSSGNTRVTSGGDRRVTAEAA